MVDEMVDEMLNFYNFISVSQLTISSTIYHLIGDFNIMPSSPQYQFMVEGQMRSNDNLPSGKR